MHKILNIEDDVMMSKAIGKILQKNNYEIISIFDGKQAFEILESQKNFDLILCDIMLPYFNGMEILSKIKSDPELRHIPVIIISHIGNEEMVKEALNLGADDFVKKPIMSGELIIRISKLINRKINLNNTFVLKKGNKHNR
jgi:DNA-binding response OmpR family regulator